MAASKVKAPVQMRVPSMAEVRARRIHELRARTVNGIAMSYQQIAAICGCSISTVANVLTGRTHADVTDVNF